ncbi:hypothetical protein AAZX31_19G059900 [Glycine max]|uniref:DUF4219 domain-containing protein n=1 Tax=Glycine max TaxID=3847 RepID=A0A0R0EUU8_SOYBN|nr:hypothetical protein JHK86_052587 [Glycine max]KAG4915115.1 hypothetical protein JHK87_052672 [Glycine soja]KAG4926950.1 hypothetical protein JHK85_053436 [Glycine max]KAG5082586.1 hypothetical protein JHK84_052624 [Glycine max]KAG5085341.1 hypothetical protein JHK82_052738 [Glycine max]
MEEGFSTKKLPIFRGVKYDYWKEQMITHFESIHIDLWDMVEHRNHIPYDDKLNEVPRSQWREEQKLTFLFNSKARNVMLCALSKEEYTNVHSFRSVKQMWTV